MYYINICHENKKTLKKVEEMLYSCLNHCPQIVLTTHSFPSLLELDHYHMEGFRGDLYFLELSKDKFDEVLCISHFIHEHSPHALIIFIAEQKLYPSMILNARPFGYLPLPLDKDKFLSLLMDALDVLPPKKDVTIQIKSGNGLCLLPLHTISVVEYGEHHVILYCVNGKTVKSKTLRTAFQDWTRPLLAYENFISPHKSYIVNMDHVSFIKNDSTFVMKTGLVVPIAHRSFPKIRKMCLDYFRRNHLLM